ncbi:MAG: hypothetical protein U5K30_11535 [Acidimicrobiales bacterium]|nr:hypothetical protein [Acidimicrobiales bacterium]
MARSISPGSVRDSTSFGRSEALTMVLPLTSATRKPTRMASSVPAVRTAAARASRWLSVTHIAAAVARIGVISGATSIAPMTTAEESASNPNPAIDDESAISQPKRER